MGDHVVCEVEACALYLQVICKPSDLKSLTNTKQAFFAKKCSKPTCAALSEIVKICI